MTRRRLLTGQDGSIWPHRDGASGAAVRETAEESGVTVEVTGLVGIYTDPGHVIAGPHAGLRQPFAVCFHARPLSGSPGGDRVSRTSQPTSARSRPGPGG